MRFDDVNSVVAEVPFMKPKQGERVFDFIVAHRLRRVLELGFAHGKTTCYLAAAVDALGNGGHVLAVDRLTARERSPNLHQLLDDCGLVGRVTPVLTRHPYSWELMRLLEQHPRPEFDLVHFGGGHTWDLTGFGFFLADRLLRPGGWMLFDDLDWSVAGSPALRDAGWVSTLSEDQRSTAPVRKVFDLLVRTQRGYGEFREEDGCGWARKRRSLSQRSGLRAG